MALEWVREKTPRWDEDKARIVGGAPEGIFELGDRRAGDLIPGEWWRVEADGRTVGYGWMDCTWGEAEILLAVDPDSTKRGVGTFILDRLEKEGASRGVNYLYNVVRPTHPDRKAVTDWLVARRFETGHDDDRLMRRVPQR